MADENSYTVRRGKLLIINNVNFTKLPTRNGSGEDVKKLSTVFEQLGFVVTEAPDLTATDMLRCILQAAEDDYSNIDCLAVAILTHGDDDGVLYGTDGLTTDSADCGMISLRRLLDPLKHCQALFAKPKLVFVQACRGNMLDSGWTADDGTQSTKAVRLPMEADFLYAYSTPPGHFSFRNSNGSWFIQELCRQLTAHLGQLASVDIVRILTRVNRQLARNKASKCETTAPEFHDKKQMPSFVSMLTADVYLTAK